MLKHLSVVCFLALFAFSAMAQKPDTISKAAKKAGSKDTLISTRQDTIAEKDHFRKIKKEKVFHPDSAHSPHLAVMHSLMVPGWGQVYNHQWWKVPVIYGVLGLFVDAIVFNNTYYKEFLALSKYREFGTTPQPGDKYYAQAILYSQQPSQALYDATDGYRRNRDLCILGFVGFWGINAIDAYIDAKFIHSFTVDNNLSMQVSPTIINQTLFAQNLSGSNIPALKVTFTF
ncbi:DUF5683 domain-containing protein [Mucilaginibacter sp.]|uniref:DUF5683 domain-containing protein n=1 Tax=Mucilaginibacter sp. TaxID=1882438 RepID=UPI0028503019|nr:DUF5683 domain-containing protein [Mucilaginibacter sp.]MDR3693476.1 DUF5683 domain-containing protein [Mucilaginibacter sp.]